MYTRRKVFSIANDYDYDYNDYYERLYSEAFEDGVDYAERMFAEEEKKSFLDTLKGLPAKAKEKIVNQWNKYAKEEGKGANWKNIGNRTAMVAAPAAVLAGLGYGGYKLATRKKEKEYSEGFEDGFDLAVQRMFAWKDEKEQKLYEKFIGQGKSKKEAAQAVLAQRSKADKQAMKDLQNQRRVANAITDPLQAKQDMMDAIKRGDEAGFTKAALGQKRHMLETEKALRLSKDEVKGLGKSLRNWKIGAGVAGGLGALGAGYGIYKGIKDED